MSQKLDGFEFWRNCLNGCRHILAPMVDQSELAFRLLVRKHYGVECCYTPMINANSFIKNIKYRNQCLQTTPEDRPLILQFCANNSDILLEASKLASNYCDAIDLNLGCPQSVAKRGHYGAFLMDEWDLIYDMIKKVSTELKIPITCKIRVFPEIDKTVEFAKMLEKAGVSLICVHGRRREQKGPLTGLADWQHIKAVKKAVKIPVFANGNILCLSDVQKCLEETGAEGVISAEGSLHNPALFADRRVAIWTVAEQYLSLVRQYPCPLSYIRGHIFKFFHNCFMLSSNLDLRERVAKAHTINVFEEVTQELKNRYQNIYENEKQNTEDWKNCSVIPPYICQSYIRPEPKPKDCTQLLSKRSSTEENEELFQLEGIPLSKKKLKRMNRIKDIKESVRSVKRILCTLCPNPKGEKCDYDICRTCCRKKTYLERLDCTGHRFHIKTRFNDKFKQKDFIDI